MKFSFVWADYCGTFGKYKDDLEKMFMYDVFLEHSFLSLTFSFRENIKPGLYPFDVDGRPECKFYYFSVVANAIEEMAVKYGYEATIGDLGGSYGHMYVISFDIKKRMPLLHESPHVYCGDEDKCTLMEGKLCNKKYKNCTLCMMASSERHQYDMKMTLNKLIEYNIK
jgi:hypothetical protein